MSIPWGLLAFWFLSPALLWGLALVGIPLLIQWLHRRRFREEPWAAMQFLRAATRSQSRRLRLESLLLVFIRSLIVLLAVLAIAGPFLESAEWFGGPGPSVRRLIVLDTSLSMGYQQDGTSRRDRARDAVRLLVEAARPGDSFQVVRIGDAPPQDIVAQPSFDGTAVLREIDRSLRSQEFGNVAPALERALELLQAPAADRRREVYIVSDFQQTNWEPATLSERDRIREAAEQLGRAEPVQLVNVGGPAVNAAVTQLQGDALAPTLGMPVNLEARINRYGRGLRASLPVELVVDGQVRQTQSVDVPANGETVVTFRTSWDEPGRFAVEVRLPEDGLIADDHRALAVHIREQLSVLLVNGRESGDAFGRASDYVELALQSLAAGAAGTSSRHSLSVQSTTLNESALVRTELSQYDVVFLCDVAFLSEVEVDRLRSFVEAGGGLIIGLGEQVQLANYNQMLHPDDDGLMPVEFLEPVGDLRNFEDVVHIDPGDYEHPSVRPFAGNPEAGLTSATFYRHVRIRIPDESVVAPSLRFTNGDVMLVERTLGNGRVLLVTSSLDDQWGSWALWPSFLPMIVELARYAAAGETSGDGLRVGQPLLRSFPVSAFGMPASMLLPDGRRVPLTPEVTERDTTVTFSQTREQGIYRLELGPPLDRTELIPVHVDAGERLAAGGRGTPAGPLPAQQRCGCATSGECSQ